MSSRTPEVSLSTSRISAIHKAAGVMSRTMVAVKDEMDASFRDESFDFGGGTPIDNPEDSIKRFLEVGDFESAVYWIDNAYAKVCEEDKTRDPVKFANYVKLLTTAQNWLRITSVMEYGDKYYTRHIVFAYFYVNALFRQKMYSKVVNTQIGHLIEVENTPVKAPVMVNGMDASFCGDDLLMADEQKVALDEMADSLSLHSAILLVLGQTFLFIENRDAATKCLKKAILMDKHCMKAEQLLLQHKLLGISDELQLKQLGMLRLPLECENDPRTMTAKAKVLYNRGDPKGAINITSKLLNAYGWYMDCLIVHVNSLVLLGDSDTLFTFSHSMVDAMPDHEFTWYAVSLYYYSCNNTASAKNYMNKATMMNTGFGDGWLALGHILASDSDTDQALSCYYRAARIMEKNFEPSLYIAMQYCKTGVLLAEQFLNDAVRIAPDSPIVYQELGCVAYNKKDFVGAMQFFERALKLVLVEEDVTKMKEFTETPSDYLRRSVHPIDTFWAPLLNNLGNCCRRIGYYEHALVYHQTALLLNPRNAHALCSTALILFVTGRHKEGMSRVHNALAMNPFDEVIRSALDSVVQLHTENIKPLCIEDVPDAPEEMTNEELDELLNILSPAQKAAQKKAKDFLKKADVRPKGGRRLRNRPVVDPESLE